MKIFYLLKTIAFLALVAFFVSCSKSGSSPTPGNGSKITITSLSVNTGPYTTLVNINGTGFSTTRTNNTVSFNGVASLVLSATATKIITYVPLAAGTGNITVSVNGNTGTGPVFTYQQTEVVTEFVEGGATDGPGSVSGNFNPVGVVTDNSGNLFVADQSTNQIKKITPNGVVSVIAGSGAGGSVDGTGTAASFLHPMAIAMDASGNFYVCDGIGRLIRKVTPAGVVTTIAGNLNTTDAVNGTGKAASFANAGAITVDGSGNLYVADQQAAQIRKITANGVVTTFYRGQGSFSPNALVMDKLGNIFLTEQQSYDVEKLTTAGQLSVFAGGTFSNGNSDGVGTAAGFLGPTQITIDANGNLFVADDYRIIRKITPGAVVSTYCGNSSGDPFGGPDGPLAVATFTAINGLTFNPSGEMYVLDNGRIRKIWFQ